MEATSGEGPQGDVELLTGEISFPPELQVYCRGDMYLYYDPAAVNYLLANKHGHVGLQALKRTGNAKDAVDVLRSSFGGDRNLLEEKLLELMDRAMRSGIVLGPGEEPRKVKFAGKSEITSLYMHVTDACNLKCVYCYNQEERGDSSKKKALSLDEAKRLLGDARNLGARHVVFTGGEPLLREKYVLGAARAARELEMTTELLTNGAKIRNDNVESIGKWFNTVTLSIDGANTETNDRVRGEGSFAKAVEAVRRLKGETDATVGVCAVITRHNETQLAEIFGFLVDELKADRVLFAEYAPSGNPEVDARLEPDYMGFIDSLGRLFYEYLKSRGPEFARMHFRLEELRPRMHCGAANGEIAVGPDGEIFPCHMLMQDSMRCGNSRKVPLGTVYENSSTMNDVRAANVEEIPECKSCEVRYVCGGGCRGIAMKLYDSVNAFNARLCSYLKASSVETLWRSASLHSQSAGSENRVGERQSEV